ncbi:MAG: nitrite reductase, copper-containing, partial [Pseudomonadota bacterium]|nr:nitrite reductase, copper-containing [Pseudomonadota bacterium]
QTPPGKEKTITFKLLHPGLFVYHCGTPMVAEHIANGMFGMILVEPAGGLPRVNEEFYVMQSEIYTAGPFGKRGNQEFSVHKLLKETPDYFVFNGSVGALTQDHPLQAKVGDTVRIFFGDAGPNFASSFHVIGEQFEKAWPWGSLANKPIRDVQTILVPPGGAFMGQFKLREPGKYILVDHALSRMEQGLSGFLLVSGSPNPALYHSGGEK